MSIFEKTQQTRVDEDCEFNANYEPLLEEKKRYELSRLERFYKRYPNWGYLASKIIGNKDNKKKEFRRYL